MQELDTNKCMTAYDLFRSHKQLEDTPYTVFKFIIWTDIPYSIIGKILADEPINQASRRIYVSDECANRFSYLATNDAIHNETICKMIDLKAGSMFWFTVKVWVIMLTTLGICIPYWIGLGLWRALKRILKYNT